MSETNTPNNPAEEKVLKAFRDGEREVIVHPDGISSISESTEWPTAEDWQGQEAILRASFMRSLFLGSGDKFAPRSVVISCARIEGSLDLNYCESLFPFHFFWCIFSEGISLRAATIPELILMKCLINQEGQASSLSALQVQVATNVALINRFIAYGEIDLNNASIGGQLSCTGGHFEKGLTAQSLKISRDVILRDGFKSNGEVNLLGADIGGQLSCTGGYFKKGLIAQSLKTGKSVHLRNEFKSNSEVDLDGASIGGQLNCSGGHFQKGLSAQNLKTGEDVILSEGFKSNGEVDIISGDIGGQLNCSGGYFGKGFIAQNLKIEKDAFLSRGFESDGKVDLLGANIGGHLNCIDGHFERGLFTQNLKAGRNVFLREGFKSNGEVNLNGASIGGQLDCINGYFGKGLTAQNLKTDRDVFLREGFKSKDEVNLSSVDINGQFDCTGGYFENGLIAQNLKTGKDALLRKGFKSNGKVDFIGADIGGQLDCTDGYFEKGLIANGLRYQRINLGGDWEKGLAWLRKIRGDGFQHYEQLMTVYRRMGHTSWARRIGFELEKERHKRSRGLWRAWYSVLRWAIGYGYKPFRALLGPIVLLSFGAILSNPCPQMIPSKFTSSGCAPDFLVNEWVPSEGIALSYWREKGRAPQGYPEFQPLIYFLEATFPVLSLGQLDKWHPDNAFFQWARWILAFIGSVLLAISTLFRVGFFFPDWKSKDDSG